MFSTLLVIPFLVNVQTHLISAQKNSSTCSAATSIEHAIWRLMFESPSVSDSLTPASPSETYDATVCGQAVPVTITRVYPTSYTEPTSATTPPKAVKLTKRVTPETATGGDLTTFTYSIDFENIGTDRWLIKGIADLLPPRLSYIAGTSSGIDTDDPVLTVNGGRDYIRWDPPGNPEVNPGETKTQSFDVTGILYEDESAYYNEAHGIFTAGLRCRSTGIQAPLTVTGGPTPPPPPPPVDFAMDMTKTVTPTTAAAFSNETFTYTMTLENTGVQNVDVQKLFDILPIEFSYVASTTSGGWISGDPQVTMDGDHEMLQWNISGSNRTFTPGEIKTVNFQATANVPDGAYENLAWAMLTENPPECVSTGDTAYVNIAGSYDITSTLDGVTVNARVTRSGDGASTVIESWQVE